MICFSLLWNFHRTESWFLMNLHKTFSICAIVFTFFKLVVGDSPDTYEKLNQNRINIVFYNTCSPYRVLVINLYLCVIKCKTSDLNFLFTPNPPPFNLNICIIYESSFIIHLLYFINIPGKSNCDWFMKSKIYHFTRWRNFNWSKERKVFPETLNCEHTKLVSHDVFKGWMIIATFLTIFISLRWRVLYKDID